LSGITTSDILGVIATILLVAGIIGGLAYFFPSAFAAAIGFLFGLPLWVWLIIAAILIIAYLYFTTENG